MKGLVLKDLYYLKGFLKQYFLVAAFLTVWSVFLKNSSFMVTYLLVMGNTLLLSTSSMDEAVYFNRFALTMPVSRKMLVQSKYILLILIETSALLVGLLFGFFLELSPYRFNGASRWVTTSFDWSGNVILFVLFVGVSSVTLPVVFKLGVEKARNIYVIVMLGLAVLIFGGLKLCQMAGISLEALKRLEEVPPVEFVTVLLALCAAVVVISYRISLRMIRNKEL